MSVLQDLVTVIDYLAATKTFPPREQAAMDRLHAVLTSRDEEPATVTQPREGMLFTDGTKVR